MSQEISNFIHGKKVAAVGRADHRPDRSQHRRGLRHRPAVPRRRHRRRLPGLGARLRELARHHAERAPARPAADRRRVRGARRGAGGDRVAEHRQAEAAHDGGGSASDVRPDPLLRGRGARARGQVGRRVHDRLHVVHPARAGRRLRGGDAVELPGDDGGLEVGAGARGRQHDGAQAVRHHARHHGVDGRGDERVPARGRVQRRLRRPRHGRRAGQRTRPRSMVSITGSVRRRHRRRQGRGRRGQARAPRARRQGAGDRVRRRRPRAGGREHRDRGLLQRRPGLHRRHPRARRPAHPRRLRLRARRAGQEHPDRPARRTATFSTARSTTPTSSRT